MSDPPKPLVAVIMGSKSDWETMRRAAEVLTEFEVRHDWRIVSASTTSAWLAAWVVKGQSQGSEL